MSGLWLVALLAGWPSPEAARARAPEILAHPGYQRTLPAGPEAPAPAAVTPLPRPPPPDPLDRDLQRGTAWLLSWALIGAVAVAAVAGLAAFGGRRRRSDREPAVAPAPAPRPGPPRDPAALAAAGRYAEAVHALLLGRIAALGAVAPGLTSREILALADLDAPAREALAQLVTAVEASRFGAAPLAAADYARCARAAALIGSGPR